ncbi:heme oxygenase (biliverdin-producing) [Natronoglycomyces albus]|uniref:Biliverdin-producing heme oxygenase n=1 Tax=Natronoglycomyces albus TaxID=2811108 RepID=A0A895XHB7_9ACTN|nr:biliverdin-producing heme oxygenase [Natronoglycomyces albus]QSB04744.1 biliverdin-producing heme oxygenase [Natronoglycomyces albus]
MTATTPAHSPAELHFSQQLREATWAIHQGLDPTTTEPKPEQDPPTEQGKGLFDRLFDGSLSQDEYAFWHAQQYFIYRELEAATEIWRSHSTAGRFVFDELMRKTELVADLQFLIGNNWRESITPLPSTQQYVHRLSEAAHQSPLVFIAHHYTRYMGDLSGGQAFKKAAIRNYGFERAGVGFYHFDHISSPKRFKDEYRSRLDAAGWNSQERQTIIDEVILAYQLNSLLISELSHRIDTEPSPKGERQR